MDDRGVLSAKVEEFMRTYETELKRALLEPLTHSKHFSLPLNVILLFDFCAELGHVLVSSPGKLMPVFTDVLHRKLCSLLSCNGLPLVPKERVHVRPCSLPLCPELQRVSVPHCVDIGRLLSFTGVVTHSGPTKMLEWRRELVCTKCGKSVMAYADFEQQNTIATPQSCPGKDCDSVKLKAVGEELTKVDRYCDYQEVKVQEQVQRLAVGSIPRSVWVVLEDDLVDSCKPGDKVTVVGVVGRRWRPVCPAQRCALELVLRASHMQVAAGLQASAALTEALVEEFDQFWAQARGCGPLQARDTIVASFCPQVFGLYVVKLCLCLALVGGVACVDAAGSKVRGDCHLLLVGDPGTAKSQLLRFAAKAVPRSVLTTGVGSTSAGLTVSAAKVEGEWQLESGALVLSDGGVCCIDEFSGIRECDRGSIHEAMEQQTLSVAKAGMVCKLNTRCTVLAATNSKGQYDQEQPVSVNVAMATPLLSRFDLILVLMDTHNEEMDEIVSSFVLNKSLGGLQCCSSGKLWSLRKLQAYLFHVRSLTPVMSERAKLLLSKYYQLQRQAAARCAARTTVRLLESLVRLAQAHSRLMYHKEVTVQDALVAISVMDCSLQGTGRFNVLHSAFPDNADEDYLQQGWPTPPLPSVSLASDLQNKSSCNAWTFTSRSQAT